MATNPIYIDPTMQYPASWTPLEYLCKCGRNVLVGAQIISGPFAAPEYQHECGKDEMHILPGPIFATWEERNGQWVRTNHPEVRDLWAKKIGRATVTYSTEGIVGRGFVHNCDVQHGDQSTRVTSIQTRAQLSRDEIEQRFANAPDVSEYIATVSGENDAA